MKMIKKIILVVVITGLLNSCISLFFPPLLHKAVMDGDLERVQKLVEKGRDINEEHYFDTPLVLAARKGEIEIAKYLLSKGAEPPKDAFAEAMKGNHIDLAGYIIKENYIYVNDNARFFKGILTDEDLPFEQRMQKVNDIADGKLTSPYLLALVEPEHYQEVIDFFNIVLTDKIEEYYVNFYSIDESDDYKPGHSILHVAAIRNNSDLVKYLIENDFDVNSVDSNKQTALFYAITYFGPKIDWKNPVIEDETTAKIHFISDMPYYSNAKAVQEKQVEIVYTLLDAGIDINQQNSEGWTVLHFASAAYPEGLQELLIEKGADAELQTKFGRTAADLLSPRE